MSFNSKVLTTVYEERHNCLLALEVYPFTETEYSIIKKHQELADMVIHSIRHSLKK